MQWQRDLPMLGRLKLNYKTRSKANHISWHIKVQKIQKPKVLQAKLYVELRISVCSSVIQDKYCE